MISITYLDDRSNQHYYQNQNILFPGKCLSKGHTLTYVTISYKPESCLLHSPSMMTVRKMIETWSPLATTC